MNEETRRRRAAIAFCCLGLFLGASGDSVRAATTNLPHHKAPFRQLAVELQDRRVLALGNFAHQNAYPFRTVTMVLSNWLSLVASNGGQLTLALEADALMADVLRQYLKTGDLEPVLEFWLPFSTLDQLEFYGRLRDFSLQVQEASQQLPTGRQVRFQVVGLEPPSPLSATNVTQADLPSIWEAGTVANERDRRIAENLMAHIKAQPQDHVLIFYGDAHLPTRPQPTSWATRIFGSGDSWRTVGARLKDQLGANFLSVGQMWYPPEAYRPESPHRALTMNDILVRSVDIPWKHPRGRLDDFDAVIFHSTPGMDQPHLLKFICCRRILDRAIARLAFLEQLPQNAFTARHSVFSTTRAGLRLTTGQSFEKAAQWKAWAATNRYDGFSRMDSDGFRKAIQEACAEPVSKQRNAMLASLGLPPALATLQRNLTEQQWREVGPEVFPAVRFLQCVGVNWVGYPEERARAREFLVEFSGKELASPDLYLQWYRTNRLGLTY